MHKLFLELHLRFSHICLGNLDKKREQKISQLQSGDSDGNAFDITRRLTNLRCAIRITTSGQRVHNISSHLRWKPRYINKWGRQSMLNWMRRLTVSWAIFTLSSVLSPQASALVFEVSVPEELYFSLRCLNSSASIEISIGLFSCGVKWEWREISMNGPYTGYCQAICSLVFIPRRPNSSYAADSKVSKRRQRTRTYFMQFPRLLREDHPI